MIEYAIEGDSTKIATTYKPLCETVITGTNILISCEQDLTKWARLEVTEINEVSSTFLYDRILPLIDGSEDSRERGRQDHGERIDETSWLQPRSPRLHGQRRD